MQSRPMSTTPELTPTDLAILDLERSWFRYPGRKEQAIRDLGMTPTDYYVRLSRLLDTPAALTHDPLLVRRLQRLRSARARARSARREGWGAG